MSRLGKNHVSDPIIGMFDMRIGIEQNDINSVVMSNKFRIIDIVSMHQDDI